MLIFTLPDKSGSKQEQIKSVKYGFRMRLDRYNFHRYNINHTQHMALIVRCLAYYRKCVDLHFLYIHYTLKVEFPMANHHII